MSPIDQTLYTKTRFAPSPTGFLHLGHVLSAIWVWSLAQIRATKIILRIEDHDQSRCREEHVDAIREDLSWLGFQWHKESRQSEHWERYENALETLRKTHHIYPCICTRKSLQGSVQDGQEPRYPGTCRHRQLGDPSTEASGIRLELPESRIHWTDLRLGPQVQIPQNVCGDLLLKDRQGQWTYQFAVTVDDWIEEIGLVVRGEDLLDSTARQIQLAQMLGKPQAPEYLHHPLLLDPQGEKLSKRQMSRSIRSERLSGASPQGILGQACFQGGILPKSEPITVQDLSALIKLSL